MAKPITIPNTFASATSAIPLSQLDQDFSTLANATNDLATYSNYVADTGAADAYIANFPANTNTSSLTAGLTIQFKAANANTGASTLNVQVNGGSIGTAAIRYANGSALAAGAIASGALVSVMYDGTNFQLINDPAGQSGGDVTGPSSATDNAIARFDGTTGKLIQNSVVTIADTTGDMSGVGTLSAGNVTVSGTANAATLISSNVTITGGTISNVTLDNVTVDVETFSNITINGTASFAAGSNTAPSITFTGDTNTGIYSPAADTIAFTEGGVEAMRIDSSGNVGIGTASPVNASNQKSITIDATTTSRIDLRSGGVARFNLQGNSTETSFVNEGLTPFVYYTNGAERMRIDSSGNVGIGTSSPDYRFTVVNAGATSGIIAGFGTNGVENLLTLAYDTAVGESKFEGSSFGATCLSAPSTNAITFKTNSLERMRIDSSGNVGIGTTSPATKFDVVSGADQRLFISTDSSSTAIVSVKADNSNYQALRVTAMDLLFATGGGNTERMRITSSGDVYVNATANVYTGTFQSNARGTDAALMGKSSEWSVWTQYIWNATTANDSRFIAFGTEGTYTQRGDIDYNRAGGVVRYNTTSDATLKNILGDSDGQKSVDILKSTRLREYAWKDDESQKPQIGVIAQELYETYKGAVSVGGEFEKTDEEGNVTTEYRPWSVDKTAFTFHLIAGWQSHEKLIQEQQAMIEDLKSRIATLEAK